MKNLTHNFNPNDILFDEEDLKNIKNDKSLPQECCICGDTYYRIDMYETSDGYVCETCYHLN